MQRAIHRGPDMCQHAPGAGQPELATVDRCRFSCFSILTDKERLLSRVHSYCPALQAFQSPA